MNPAPLQVSPRSILFAQVLLIEVIIADTNAFEKRIFKTNSMFFPEDQIMLTMRIQAECTSDVYKAMRNQ